MCGLHSDAKLLAISFCFLLVTLALSQKVSKLDFKNYSN